MSLALSYHTCIRSSTCIHFFIHLDCSIQESSRCHNGELPGSSYNRWGLRCVRFSLGLSSSSCRPIYICLFNSGARQVLARPEWHIYVSLSLTDILSRRVTLRAIAAAILDYAMLTLCY